MYSLHNKSYFFRRHNSYFFRRHNSYFILFTALLLVPEHTYSLLHCFLRVFNEHSQQLSADLCKTFGDEKWPFAYPKAHNYVIMTSGIDGLQIYVKLIIMEDCMSDL